MSAHKMAKTARIPINKKQAPREPLSHAIPLLLYRRIAIVFVILVVTVLFVVLYLSTMKAVIRVTTVSKEITTDFIVQTVEVAVKEGEIQGEIYSGSLGRKKVVTPTEPSQKAIDGQAVGTVTIKNIMSTPQLLVATTRFLTPEGILYRLKKTLTIPAQGSVEAEVYADKKGVEGNIGPSSFTIPGLSQAKQTLVTAQSLAPMTGGVKFISVLSQAEIDRGFEGLKAELLEDAKAMLRAQRQPLYTGEAFFVEVLDQKTDVKAGEEVGTFDVELKVSVTAVFYDEEALKKITLRKLHEGLGQGREFVDFGEENRRVTVQQVNLQDATASIQVSQTGRAMTSKTSQALEAGRFVGMSEEEVRRTLIQEGVATSVDVQFFPFWVRKVSRLVDHVYLEIK